MEGKRSELAVHDGHHIWICITRTQPQLCANVSVQCDAAGAQKSDQTVKLGSVDKMWIKIL